MESENMNEGLYLEAMNQLKEINDERDRQSKKHKDELLQLKKEMITVYGVVRLLDNLYEHSEDGEIEIKILIETLREYLSQFTEDNIFYVNN